jgi:hypothetical protein
MGFRKQEKVYVLQFDGELEGLEVRMRGASAGELLKLEGMKYNTPEKLHEVFTFFGSKINSWNLEEEDGTPITFDPQKVEVIDPEWDPPRSTDVLVLLTPPMVTRLETVDEAKARVLEAQDIDFVFDVMSAWKNALTGVSDPLERNSRDGERFPEESIPMETLSSSQSS